MRPRARGSRRRRRLGEASSPNEVPGGARCRPVVGLKPTSRFEEDAEEDSRGFCAEAGFDDEPAELDLVSGRSFSLHGILPCGLPLSSYAEGLVEPLDEFFAKRFEVGLLHFEIFQPYTCPFFAIGRQVLFSLIQPGPEQSRTASRLPAFANNITLSDAALALQHQV